MPSKDNTLGRIIFYSMFIGWFLLGALLHNAVIMLMPLIVFAIASVTFGWNDWSIYKKPIAVQDYDRGLRYLQSNEWDKAIECFNHAISRNPRFAAAYENRALALLKKDNPYRAIRDLSEAIRLRPNNTGTYFNRALTYFQMGDYDKALADCDQASKLDQNASILLLRGQIFLAKGQNKEAISVFERAVEESRGSSAAHLELANAYARVGNNDLALKNYSITIEIEPRSAILYNTRAIFYARMGELPKALTDCNRAISLDPKLMYAFGNRGQTYFLMEKYQDALIDFNRATKLKPDYKLAIVGQALCQNALGNKKEVLQLWQSVIQLDRQYTIDKLIEDYNPAKPFVDAAHRLVADLNIVQTHNT